MPVYVCTQSCLLVYRVIITPPKSTINSDKLKRRKEVSHFLNYDKRQVRVSVEEKYNKRCKTQILTHRLEQKGKRYSNL